MLSLSFPLLFIFHVQLELMNVRNEQQLLRSNRHCTNFPHTSVPMQFSCTCSAFCFSKPGLPHHCVNAPQSQSAISSAVPGLSLQPALPWFRPGTLPAMPVFVLLPALAVSAHSRFGLQHPGPAWTLQSSANAP